MRNLNLKSIPEPANKILCDLIEGIDLIVANFINGVYITGSIALEDFHPEKSDIDFIITCKALPDDKIATKLKVLHKQIQRQFPKPDLSGCYVATESLSFDNISAIKILSWHEGSLRFQNFEIAAVSLYELKTSAFTLFGDDARQLPIKVSKELLNDFMHHNINSYWKSWKIQHSNWLNRKMILFLFPRFTEWVVLGLARMLCTLQIGRIVSKIEAGNYCLENMPKEFHSVVRNAIDIRNDNRVFPIVRSYAVRPSFKRLQATLDCADYLFREFNKAYEQKSSMTLTVQKN